MVKPLVIAACSLSCGLWLSGCGGGGGSDMRPDNVLQSVSIGGVPGSIVPPNTAQLTATATFTNSTTQNVTSAAVWASSNATVASVNPAGLLTAVSAGGPVTITATYQNMSGTAAVTVTGASLRANPGGPYQTQHNQNITFSGLTSTSSPFSITRFSWNCGQSAAVNCDQEGPTPTFNYRRCGGSNRPACRSGSDNLADYTVRLTITDSQGNTNTATTTVTVTNSY